MLAFGVHTPTLPVSRQRIGGSGASCFTVAPLRGNISRVRAITNRIFALFFLKAVDRGKNLHCRVCITIMTSHTTQLRIVSFDAFFFTWMHVHYPFCAAPKAAE